MKNPNRHEAWNDLAGRLKNYKELHRETAEKQGKLEKFLKARTLTEAKKILKGQI